jgi:hypothetical protein
VAEAYRGAAIQRNKSNFAFAVLESGKTQIEIAAEPFAEPGNRIKKIVAELQENNVFSFWIGSFSR